MSIFRRVLRWLFILAGILAGVVTAVAVLVARKMIAPPRQKLWATPGDINVEFEEISFPAQDGVRLSGWFIPALADSFRKGATLIVVHGWPWNRLGETAEDPMAKLDGTQPVDLLRLIYSLHKDGFNVLTFDLRNHGESAAMPPVTFGVNESQDLLGALGYLNGRSDIAQNRIGVIGFSMGANTLLYTLPKTDRIKAAVAVQPTTASVFSKGYGRYVLSHLSILVQPLAEFFYTAMGGPPLASIQPAEMAALAGDVPILYVQGDGDPWGSAEDVKHMASVTPQPSGPLMVDTNNRFAGYQYIVDNPKIISAFFEQHLPE